MYEFENASLSDATLLSHLWIETFTQAYVDVHTPENIEAYCSENFTLKQAKAVLSDQKTKCVLARKSAKTVGF